MKTTALRLYGAMDLRLESFELPEITADELLLRVESDTVCASTYKAVKQGSNHKRVPPDIAEHPVIVGHEMCGTVEKVGANLKNEWKVGQRAVIQPALKLESGTPTTMSASTGCSCHSSLPEFLRNVWTLQPSISLSGRAK